ncbi:MAG: Oxygen-independent coproporphyrinogen-III oxidase-like protein YqeR [Cellvibrionales bacterium UBA7375]|nr:MAG: Oxygen-independent coproporphyrinogen-III oxidase-like protein YqeR [Cellvibrionales bacterium UBA7375]
MLELPPLSLYVHIPWCVRKCPYCDFNSHESAATIPENDYLQALFRDLTNDLPWVQNRKIHSIFFGGGTPSLFSANAIEKIIQRTETLIGFEDDIEITLEANPGTAEQQKFADFNAAGVNRLSIGVQSFNNDHLSALGRIHDSDNALKAIEMAHICGFERFNIDLMHGLPNQTRAQAVSDLETAINTGATHISWYQLTIEPNTAFYSKPPILPIEDQLADIQDLGQQTLAKADFEQYEISAFARNNQQCKHNINYWQFGDYLGIGAGAHGKITLPDQNSIIRSAKTRLPKHYLNQDTSQLTSDKPIAQDQLVLEFMMNGLRLTAGVKKDLLNSRTGLSTDQIEDKIEQLNQEGFLKHHPSYFCTTELGARFLDTLLQRFS